MSQSNWVHIENCTILKESEKAFFVSFRGRREWFPKSQIDEPDRLDECDEGVTVSISEWLAGQKDIEGD